MAFYCYKFYTMHFQFQSLILYFFVHLFKVVGLSVFSFIRVSIEIYIDLPVYDHMLNVFKVKLLP